jgi:hypothetical protein
MCRMCRATGYRKVSTCSSVRSEHIYSAYPAFLSMPESPKQSEVSGDPTVQKQWGRDTPMSKQIDELYQTIDGHMFCMLNSYRPGTSGPDLLFPRQQELSEV